MPLPGLEVAGFDIRKLVNCLEVEVHTAPTRDIGDGDYTEACTVVRPECSGDRFGDGAADHRARAFAGRHEVVVVDAHDVGHVVNLG